MLQAELQWDNLDAAFEQLEADLTNVARGLAVRAWDALLARTPQFYGRMTASWTFSLNSPVFVDRSDAAWAEQTDKIDEGPFAGLRQGHPVAIELANFYNAGRDKAFKLGDTVWFANGVDHGEGPYSQDVEDGNINLRAENLPGEPARRAIDWIGLRYAEITPNQARLLRARTLGEGSGTSDS